MRQFTPRLDILPTPQRRLWDDLVVIPPPFVLYGGTAIALHLGHRVSVDFDFFANAAFDPDRLYRQISFLAGAEVTQKAADTLSCIVDRDGPVRVSFFGDLGLGRVREPLIADAHGLQVADLVDLAGTKAAVVQKRAEARDYVDLDAMIHSGAVDLATALAAGQVIYGIQFNPLITLKALSYFADLPSLPSDVRERLAAAATAIDIDQLPSLKAPG